MLISYLVVFFVFNKIVLLVSFVLGIGIIKMNNCWFLVIRWYVLCDRDVYKVLWDYKGRVINFIFGGFK